MTIRDTMLTYVCAYCGAGPGQWCVTRSGNPAGHLHGERWWAWKRDTDAAHDDHPG